jgi:hypothetical protein
VRNSEEIAVFRLSLAGMVKSRSTPQWLSIHGRARRNTLGDLRSNLGVVADSAPLQEQRDQKNGDTDRR